MRRFLVSAILLLSAVSLVGCSPPSGGAGSSVSTGAPGSSSSTGGDSKPAPAELPKNGSPERSGGVVADAGSGRQVITNGSVTMTVDNPATAADDASRIVENAGGRVDGREEQAPADGNQGTARLTVRIPSNKLSATLDRLKKLGTVANISISKQDVTLQSKDLDARITALRTSVNRLIDLMSKAATTADLISIETALSERQANLEGLESQKRFLDDQVDLSTIILNLDSPATAARTVPNNFLSGLVAGWNAFVAFLAGILVVIGVLLPWLIVLALIVLVVILIIRRSLRRRARALVPAEREPVKPAEAKPDSTSEPVGR